MIDTQKLDPLTGLNRFTDNAKTIVIRATELAKQYGNVEVTPIHIFLSLLLQPSRLITAIFEQVQLDLEQTKEKMLTEVQQRRKTGTLEPIFSSSLKELINQSFLMAEKLSHVYVGTEHLLMALLENSDEKFVSELKQVGLNSDTVAAIALKVGNYLPGILSQTKEAESEEDAEDEGSLPYFGRNMNEQAEDEEFLNITGRDKEIDRLIHILARKTKNNPILVGDAGVGKTAVVQGLVQRIVRGDVPPSFLGMTVISLDVPTIIAGSRVRGDVEERILGLVREAIDSGDKIIFIDEIHMIVGAGSQGGRDPMDIGNILKPYLTDTNLRIIGATTVSEYHKYFDDDPALSRRFQPVSVEEIDKDSALEILRNLKGNFEKYHGVRIKDQAIIEAVNLSSKFIADRYLPDKAIDLLDEAAATVKIGREVFVEPELSKLGEKLLKVQKRKEQALFVDNMKDASKLKQQEEEISVQIADLMGGKHTKARKFKVVDPELVRQIVVEWTKIPLAAGNMSDVRLKALEKKFKERVIGQDHVVTEVADAIRRSHLGLTDHRRPLASFMFLGPTGVGKTELARQVALSVFGSSDLLVQINMSEFMEMHSISKLIGSPPGYIGYQEGGQLTEKIRRQPYSVVLFDEIEKAHPDVLNLLLQILEEGELTDGKGRKASFRNTIVILTSNIGAEDVSSHSKLGFNIAVEDIEKTELDRAFEDMREQLLISLKNTLRPELLNRLDTVSVFRGLNTHDCVEIAGVMLEELALRLLDNGIVLTFANNVAKLIGEKGYSKEYGARNVRRKVQEMIENSLASYLLEEKIILKPGKLTKLHAKVKGESIIFIKV